jgi:hypothetical protein
MGPAGRDAALRHASVRLSRIGHRSAGDPRMRRLRYLNGQNYHENILLLKNSFPL